MTRDVEVFSKPTPETYFWLGIYHNTKWQYVDQTEAVLRNWNTQESDGQYGAVALGKLNEGVFIYYIGSI